MTPSEQARLLDWLKTKSLLADVREIALAEPLSGGQSSELVHLALVHGHENTPRNYVLRFEQRGKQLFLKPANRQYATTQCNFTGHGIVCFYRIACKDRYY